MHVPTLLVGAVFFLIGAGGGAAGAYLLTSGEEQRLAREGRRAHAQVLHKSIHANRTEGSVGRPAYRVDYRFVPARGVAVTGARDIDAALWNRIGRGDSLEVVYLPSDPSAHRVETEANNRAVAIVFALVGVTFALLGAWLLRQAFAGSRSTPGTPPPSPAADRLSAAFTRSPAFVFGVAGLLFFLPFAVAGVAWFTSVRAEEALFSARALSIDGLVLDKAVVRTRTSVGNRPSGTSPHYHGRYRYASDTGQEIVGTSSVGSDTWERLKERGPIAVRFVAGQPWLHRLQGEGADWTGPIAFLSLGGFGMRAGALAAIWGWPKWKRNTPRHSRASPARSAAPAAVQAPPARVQQPTRWALFFGGVFFLAGTFASIDAALDLLRERRYAAEGRVAQAHIVDKRVEEAQRSGNTRTQYVIAYRFTTPDGVAVEGAAAVDFDVWEAAKRDDSLRVRYVATAPSINRAEAEDGTTGAILVTLMGFVFAVVGAAIAYVGWWRPR